VAFFNVVRSFGVTNCLVKLWFFGRLNCEIKQSHVAMEQWRDQSFFWFTIRSLSKKISSIQETCCLITHAKLCVLVSRQKLSSPKLIFLSRWLFLKLLRNFKRRPEVCLIYGFTVFTMFLVTVLVPQLHPQHRWSNQPIQKKLEFC
jgi:hypothetical protein